MKFKLLFFIVFFLISLSANYAWALKSDKQQPADISADDISFDFKTGVRTYVQNVVIRQGTLYIKADKIVTYNEGSTLKKAIATAAPVYFKQLPDGKKEYVEGWAKKITVDQAKNLLTLQGKASLRQGADTVRGETIIYNMANDQLKIKGGKQKPANIKANQEKQAAPKIANQAEKVNQEATSQPEPVAPKAQPRPKEEFAPKKSGRSRLILRPRKKQDKQR